MPRTTVDIDGPILRELKRLGRREGKSLGRLVSDLLADALGRRRQPAAEPAPLVWHSAALGARVDIEDREALERVLDGDLER